MFQQQQGLQATDEMTTNSRPSDDQWHNIQEDS